MSSFHFLRPESLFLLLPWLVVILMKRRSTTLQGQWQKLIHPALQPYVLQAGQGKGNASHWLSSTPLIAASLLAIIALSGPTWEKQDSPVYHNRAGLVIALDLSLSMTAQDVSPSRLQRAKYKIMDVFDQTQIPAMALLAYAGDTHVATPLTRDTKTIAALLPSLSPYMMPAQGSHLVRLAQQTVNLFNQADSQPRQLLLITDGAEMADVEEAARLFNENQIKLSILAVGTDQGAPLVKPDGSFFSDAQGNVIMPGLEIEPLQALQQATDGKLARFTNDDRDIQYLLDHADILEDFEQTEENQMFDQWHDAGYLLLLIVMPLMLFAFRRGVILVLVCTVLPLMSEPSYAFEWRDWFRNDNQEGQARFEQNPKAAAEHFSDPNWKAASEYKAGNYEAAVKHWEQTLDTSNAENADDKSVLDRSVIDSHFNRGNALAKLNKFDEAIAAYDRVLKDQPDHEDAAFNRALVEQLKQNSQQQNSQNQEQQDQQQSQEGQQGDQSQQSSQQSGDQNSSQDQQNQSQGQSQSDQENAAQNSGQNDEQDPLKKQQAEQSQAQEHNQEQNEDGQNNSEDAQQASAAEQAKSEQEKTEQQQAQGTEPTQTQTEQQQALQQWINRIPDDPGDLLENKFRRQYNNRHHQDNNEDRKPW